MTNRKSSSEHGTGEVRWGRGMRDQVDSVIEAPVIVQVLKMGDSWAGKHRRDPEGNCVIGEKQGVCGWTSKYS